MYKEKIIIQATYTPISEDKPWVFIIQNSNGEYYYANWDGEFEQWCSKVEAEDYYLQELEAEENEEDGEKVSGGPVYTMEKYNKIFNY